MTHAADEVLVIDPRFLSVLKFWSNFDFRTPVAANIGEDPVNGSGIFIQLVLCLDHSIHQSRFSTNQV